MEGVNLRLGLPARIFATMLRVLPRRVGDRMWRWWYQRLAKAKAWGEFGFMNYGFIDDNPPDLEPEDESDEDEEPEDESNEDEPEPIPEPEPVIKLVVVIPDKAPT